MMSETYRKDVTDEEIKEAMEPVLKELEKYLVPRVTPESDDKAVQEDKEDKKEEPKKPFAISEEEKEYMKSILEHPSLSVTARGQLFGFSADKMTRIKKALLDKSLITEFSVDLGASFGGRVKFLRLADDGYKAIEEKPPERKHDSSNRPSLEHVWWQEAVARDYSERGYRAVIEKTINGKSADIGVMTEDETVAVEVELSPKNAVTNFKKDIDAGFDRVIIACRNNRVKKEAEKKLGFFLGENSWYANKSKVILLSDFPFVKKLYREIRG